MLSIRETTDWASRKREVLNMLHHRMKEEQSYQGRLFSH